MFLKIKYSNVVKFCKKKDTGHGDHFRCPVSFLEYDIYFGSLPSRNKSIISLVRLILFP